jgi:hypothetical protein
MRRDYILDRITDRNLYRNLHRRLGGLSLSYGGRRRPAYFEGLLTGSGIGMLGSAVLEWLDFWAWLAGMM